LTVSRPDPENREFRHPDPIGWTEANRGRILRALYTILLGNPRFGALDPTPAETRFKMWYHLIGSAIEHAAERHAEINPTASSISFRDMFRASEADEEQGDALATVIETLRTVWPNGFKAGDVYAYAISNDTAGEFKAALEEAAGKRVEVLSPKTITWRLKAICDAPIELDGRVFVLKWTANKTRHGGDFRVEAVSG
jgi:hypothetical protein